MDEAPNRVGAAWFIYIAEMLAYMLAIPVSEDKSRPTTPGDRGVKLELTDTTGR